MTLRFAVAVVCLVAACESSEMPAVLTENAAATGLDFTHVTGASGEFYLPEIVGSGVGLLDYDGDGDLDVFFAQGAALDSSGAGNGSGNRLFRNDLVPGGVLKFVDVSDVAGQLGGGFSVGVAAADIDDDGDTDLFVSGVEADTMLRNDGGRFTDISATAGVDDERWNASATFFDFDADNDLDLFVTAYVAEPIAANRLCRNQADQRDYCSPSNFEALSDRLYANDGSGRFRDVSAAAGIDATAGAGLGVVAADFDGNGWPDVYVANDQTPNHLWINAGDGTFSERALMSGAAYNADGLAEASMGITSADFDGDGDEDLFMTHLNAETNTLYRNDGKGNFFDATDRASLGAQSLSYTGWGAQWFDVDHDADLDLYVANGAITLDTAQGETDRYGQYDQLWINEGGRFAPDAAPFAGRHADNSRGAAFGDIDNDGDIDIVVSAAGGPARLYLNQSGDRGNWLQVSLESGRGNREAIGARVAIVAADGSRTWRRVARDGSFASTSDVRVHFGLGTTRAVDVGVVWPDGARELFRALSANQHVLLRRGTGGSWP